MSKEIVPGAIIPIAIPLILAGLAPVIPLLLLIEAHNYSGCISDFPEYYASARLILEGKGAFVYSLPELGRVQQELFPNLNGRVIGLYVYPFSLPFLLLLGLLPLQAAPAVWTVLIIIAFSGSIVVLGRTFHLTQTQVLLLYAFSWLFGPLYEAIRIGQLSPFLLLFFAGGIAALKSERWLVAALMLSCLLLKLQELLPFIAFLAGARRYRVLCYFVCLALFCFLISLLMLGFHGYENYYRLIMDAGANSTGMQPELNPTFRGQLLRLFPHFASLVSLVAAVVFAVALVFCFCLGRRMSGSKKWLEPALIGAMPLGLVTTIHMHDYDLLLLLPGIVALISSGLLSRICSLQRITILMLAPAFFLPAYSIIHYSYMLQGGVVNPLFVMLACLAALLFALSSTVDHSDQAS